jgi:hypothetical protein
MVNGFSLVSGGPLSLNLKKKKSTRLSSLLKPKKKKGTKHITQSILRISNDPTAGSPTVTLLRLLLPLNDQV